MTSGKKREPKVPPVEVKVTTSFPADCTYCEKCGQKSVSGTATQCMNCGAAGKAAKIEMAWTNVQENKRAAEAGKAMLPLPMPVQFTARELIAVKGLVSSSAHIHQHALKDEKGANILKGIYDKLFDVERAWWDDAEASTKLWNLIDKLDLSEKSEEKKP